ncbi:MAG TPA: M56 family metallopeptidase [Anaeromyxobacteraceae bacterium]|nr:M56 family metallopeptidase [Anaeromyxobacteraceae bacterium]
MTVVSTWADILTQAIFHSLVASLFVEALVRGWQVAEPRQRIALRLLALGYPLVLFPGLVALGAERGEESFRDATAIFSARAWDDLRFLRLGLNAWWTGFFAAAGIALFLIDFLPLFRRKGRPPGAAAGAEVVTRLDAVLFPVARKLGVRAPPVRWVDSEVPMLFCTGVRRQEIVVSRGALGLLDDEELEAAFAHELAHLSRHDPATSWAIMAARGIMFFNPAFQVVSRVIIRDAEHVADERAAAVCGHRLPLAAGLLKLHRATSRYAPVPRSLPFAAALTEPIEKAHARDLEVRCRRLLGPAPRPLRFGPARIVLAAAALTAVLYFVV